MVKIAAKARKVGNSFVITIPTDLSNQLELILDKLNEESIKERELRAKSTTIQKTVRYIWSKKR